MFHFYTKCSTNFYQNSSSATNFPLYCFHEIKYLIQKSEWLEETSEEEVPALELDSNPVVAQAVGYCITINMG